MLPPSSINSNLCPVSSPETQLIETTGGFRLNKPISAKSGSAVSSLFPYIIENISTPTTIRTPKSPNLKASSSSCITSLKPINNPSTSSKNSEGFSWNHAHSNNNLNNNVITRNHSGKLNPVLVIQTAVSPGRIYNIAKTSSTDTGSGSRSSPTNSLILQEVDHLNLKNINAPSSSSSSSVFKSNISPTTTPSNSSAISIIVSENARRNSNDSSSQANQSQRYLQMRPPGICTFREDDYM